ncbi:MAG: hypothetical protein J6Q81_00170 [Lentisphaeria bacterium]|nr:hypothetical protein [Lentisphaeria bacterium]
MKINFAKMLFAAAVSSIILTGCANSCPVAAKPEAKVEKKLKVGYYVDNGSRSNGAFQWAQLLFYSPQLDVTLLMGEDIRAGKLDELDLLVIPGGSSESQVKALGDEGKKKVQDFVRNGGAYVGICAGFHCTLDRKERLQLMPYKYLKGAGGAAAKLAMDINERGGKILGVKPGRYNVRYSLGPISKPAKWDKGNAETLGVYKSTVGPKGRPGGNFFDAPAIIYGNYGKGKIVATSFHPEAHINNHDMAMGLIYSVTGVRPTPIFPKRNYRPIRVAFITYTTIGKEPMKRMLELDRHPDIDVILNADFTEGILRHVDVLVVPDAIDAKNIGLAQSAAHNLKEFLENGGKILVSGAEAKAFPKHRNVVEIPAGKSFVEEVLKKPIL